MNSGTVIMSLVILAIVIIPVVIIARSKKKNQ